LPENLPRNAAQGVRYLADIAESFKDLTKTLLHPGNCVSFLQRLPKFRALARRKHFISESVEVSFAGDEEGIGCRAGRYCHIGTGTTGRETGGPDGACTRRINSSRDFNTGGLE
jgi:hypothetical protein